MHISLSIVDYRERETDTEREKERGRGDMVKPQKWYYLHNMRSAYFPIIRTLQGEKEIEEWRKRERHRKRERC